MSLVVLERTLDLARSKIVLSLHKLDNYIKLPYFTDSITLEFLYACGKENQHKTAGLRLHDLQLGIYSLPSPFYLAVAQLSATEKTMSMNLIIEITYDWITRVYFLGIHLPSYVSVVLYEAIGLKLGALKIRQNLHDPEAL